MRMRALLAAIGVVGAMVPMAVQATADTIVACEAPTVDMEFEQAYIDETRAGGEPILETLQDGTLLWGSHAGTTHFYSPTVADQTSAAFVQNYEGQTYQYWSDDDGATWHFSPRNAIQSAEQGSLAGVNNSGFSDPVFAEDMAGNQLEQVSATTDGSTVEILDPCADVDCGTHGASEWLKTPGNGASCSKRAAEPTRPATWRAGGAR